MSCSVHDMIQLERKGIATVTICTSGFRNAGMKQAAMLGIPGLPIVDIPFPFYRLASRVEAYVDGTMITPVATDGDAYERQIEAFARSIRTGEPPTPNVHDGLAAVRLIEAVATAVESGAEVRP